MYYLNFGDIPKNHYKVLLCDPPWTYNDKAAAGKRGACFKYSVMPYADICALPVPNITAPDTVLFLWVTGPHAADGLHVDLMKAWGFTPKTLAFTWVKRNKKSPSWFWGMGRYTRANAELCFLGTRGKGLPRINAGVHSIVDTRVREHSRKPAEVRSRIELLFGDVPRIELFARGEAPGWDQFGNESGDVAQGEVAMSTLSVVGA